MLFSLFSAKLHLRRACEIVVSFLLRVRLNNTKSSYFIAVLWQNLAAFVAILLLTHGYRHLLCAEVALSVSMP